MDQRPRHLVQSVRYLTDESFVIRVERHSFFAAAGQHVTLGPRQFAINREFSIYSAPDKPYIEFLIKARAGSETALALRQARPGDEVDLAGPYGEFVIAAPEERSRRYLFVATGVGIAPFHCFVTHYPKLDYTLVHGIPRLEDRYDLDDYESGRYVACVSRETGGDYHGRVTDYLREHPVDPQRLCYVCGRSSMVSSVYDLLRAQGVPSDNLLTETFF
ncbi:MAG: FAD-dependent oxidoreductase [Kiritimatiellae bacterium]|nr:FAD-dependent oxidoreductase [Kiritimatiellia bacterium]